MSIANVMTKAALVVCTAASGATYAQNDVGNSQTTSAGADTRTSVYVPHTEPLCVVTVFPAASTASGITPKPNNVALTSCVDTYSNTKNNSATTKTGSVVGGQMTSSNTTNVNVVSAPRPSIYTFVPDVNLAARSAAANNDKASPTSHNNATSSTTAGSGGNKFTTPDFEKGVYDQASNTIVYTGQTSSSFMIGSSSKNTTVTTSCNTGEETYVSVKRESLFGTSNGVVTVWVDTPKTEADRNAARTRCTRAGLTPMF